MFQRKETSSSSAPHCCNQLRENEWLVVQDSLKKKLIVQDDFHWKLPVFETETAEKCGGILKYVGGVDLSFSKDDPSVACATLVVLDIENRNVVYQDSSVVKLDVPYIPGFLAFREAPVLLELLEKMKTSANPLYPQLLMVDGNGILHPRGFGLACHLGVLADLPTVGIGKNLHHVDGLTFAKVRHLLEENSSQDILTLVGDSGCTLGASQDENTTLVTCLFAMKAMRSNEGSLKPIFVSIGHRISLDTATNIVKITCRFRIPEPIRQADIRSKECLRKLFGQK